MDDQLVRVTFDEGIPATEQTIEYGYNHQGDRTRREVTGHGAAPEDLDKLYLTDRKNLTGYCQALAEVDGQSGDTLRNYVYGPDYAPLAQSTAAGAPDFFHADHLGTTRALTTSSGSASPVQQYEPYGTPSNGALSSLTSKYFTAQDRDVYTNLQYHRARWLDTNQGRWYSQDPIFDFPSNFGSGYGYAGGEVNLFYDLSGMLSLVEVSVVSGVIGLTGGIDIYSSIKILHNQGGEAAQVGDLIVTILKVMGSIAFSFVPIIGQLMMIKDMYDIIMDIFKFISTNDFETVRDAFLAFALILVIIVATIIAAKAVKYMLKAALAKIAYTTVSTGGSKKLVWRWGLSKIKTESEAAEAYLVIKNSSTDTAAIARYTGFKEEKIRRIKKYLFDNSEFTPDQEIAMAWHRLRTGSHTADDILLLKHETAEMWLKTHPEKYLRFPESYRKKVSLHQWAHQFANDKYNWQEAVDLTL